VVTGSGRLVAVSGQVALEYVGTDRLPASTAVQVAALFRPELLLEVEALAIVQR
jgi:enamine deaminase RidA (YjgF/YER057c/UK114 family)